MTDESPETQCQATCGNNDGTYTDCTLDAAHADVIPSIPHSFEIVSPTEQKTGDPA